MHEYSKILQSIYNKTHELVDADEKPKILMKQKLLKDVDDRIEVVQTPKISHESRRIFPETGEIPDVFFNDTINSFYHILVGDEDKQKSAQFHTNNKNTEKYKEINNNKPKDERNLNGNDQSVNNNKNNHRKQRIKTYKYYGIDENNMSKINITRSSDMNQTQKIPTAEVKNLNGSLGSKQVILRYIKRDSNNLGKKQHFLFYFEVLAKNGSNDSKIDYNRSYTKVSPEMNKISKRDKGMYNAEIGYKENHNGRNAAKKHVIESYNGNQYLKAVQFFKPDVSSHMVSHCKYFRHDPGQWIHRFQ